MDSVGFASSENIRVRMANQKRRNTGPEMALRSALHRRGLRYRLHRQIVPGTRRGADLVFPRARVAVFVDGCFWHLCPIHGVRDHRVNGWYWPAKLERNRQRDEDTNRRLQEAGWTVVRVWEHEDAELAADEIRRVVLADRSGQ